MRKQGYVYLMSLGGYHKIGASRNPERRVKDFDGLPWVAELLHSIPCKNAFVVEKVFQRRFAKKRIRKEKRRSEWFALNDDDIAIICGIQQCDRLEDLPALFWLEFPKSKRFPTSQAFVGSLPSCAGGLAGGTRSQRLGSRISMAGHTTETATLSRMVWSVICPAQHPR